MYYKITNKESELYKKLFEIRVKEKQIAKDNEAAIEERTGLTWQKFIGHSGQQNFRRVTQYEGFAFTEPDKVDPKIWKRHSQHNEIFVPNNRTKAGREMHQFILNGLKSSNYNTVIDILGLPCLRRFTFPFVECAGDAIVIYLGDGHEPKDENLIEITKNEFNTLLKSI